MNLYITANGTLHAVSTEEAERVTRSLGDTTKRRASNVVPANWFKRQAFRVIRGIVGERGRLAEFCRSWHGHWQVRFTDAPDKVAFSHPSRHVCIKWEIEQLEKQFAQQ